MGWTGSHLHWAGRQGACTANPNGGWDEFQMLPYIQTRLFQITRTPSAPTYPLLAALPQPDHIQSIHLHCECQAAVHTQFKWYSRSLPGSPGASWVSSRPLPSEVNTQAGTCCSSGWEAHKNDDAISFWICSLASVMTHISAENASIWRQTKRKKNDQHNF